MAVNASSADNCACPAPMIACAWHRVASGRCSLGACFHQAQTSTPELYRFPPALLKYIVHGTRCWLHNIHAVARSRIETGSGGRTRQLNGHQAVTLLLLIGCIVDYRRTADTTSSTHQALSMYWVLGSCKPESTVPENHHLVSNPASWCLSRHGPSRHHHHQP